MHNMSSLMITIIVGDQKSKYLITYPLLTFNWICIAFFLTFIIIKITMTNHSLSLFKFKYTFLYIYVKLRQLVLTSDYNHIF